MEPVYFPTPEELRNWFLANHEHVGELLVGYYKKGSKVMSIDWPQSVDQALCFGWIDGIRRSIDADRYCIRFTPRRKNSIWSAVNLRRFEELDRMGLVTKSGRQVFDSRNPEKAQLYSFEQENPNLNAAYEEIFKANSVAWEKWNAMIPSYRKPASWWVMSAKQEATRLKRLETLIQCSEIGRKIPTLRRKPHE